MTTFINNDVSSGNVIYASDHNEQGARVAAVVNGNIDVNNLADSSVTTPKIADSSVTFSKLDPTTFTFQSYTPTVTGFSVVPPGAIYRYFLFGKLCILTLRQPTVGTSNSTALTITAPFVSANISGHAWEVYIDNYIDNGTTGTAGIASISANSNVITFYRSALGQAWTASGSKRINAFQIIYEIA